MYVRCHRDGGCILFLDEISDVINFLAVELPFCYFLKCLLYIFLFRDTMHVMNVTMVFLLRYINCYMCVFAFSGFLNSVMSWVAGWFVSSENSESTDASSQA